MHEHSDKIQPKKLIITIFLTILLFLFAYLLRKNSDAPNKELNNPVDESEVQKTLSEISTTTSQ